MLGFCGLDVFIISMPPGLAFNGLLALGAEPMLPPEPPPNGGIFFFTIAISAAPFGWTFAGCFRHWFLILHFEIPRVIKPGHISMPQLLHLYIDSVKRHAPAEPYIARTSAQVKA